MAEEAAWEVWAVTKDAIVDKDGDNDGYRDRDGDGDINGESWRGGNVVGDVNMGDDGIVIYSEESSPAVSTQSSPVYNSTKSSNGALLNINSPPTSSSSSKNEEIENFSSISIDSNNLQKCDNKVGLDSNQQPSEQNISTYSPPSHYSHNEGDHTLRLFIDHEREVHEQDCVNNNRSFSPLGVKSPSTPSLLLSSLPRYESINQLSSNEKSNQASQMNQNIAANDMKNVISTSTSPSTRLIPSTPPSKGYKKRLHTSEIIDNESTSSTPMTPPRSASPGNNTSRYAHD